LNYTNLHSSSNQLKLNSIQLINLNSIYIIKKMLFVCLCHSYLPISNLTKEYPFTMEKHMLWAFSCLWYLCHEVFELCLSFLYENWNTKSMINWHNNMICYNKFKLEQFNKKSKQQFNMIIRNWNNRLIAR